MKKFRKTAPSEKVSFFKNRCHHFHFYSRVLIYVCRVFFPYCLLKPKSHTHTYTYINKYTHTHIYIQSRGHLVADVDPLGITTSAPREIGGTKRRANENVTRSYFNFGKETNIQHFYFQNKKKQTQNTHTQRKKKNPNTISQNLYCRCLLNLFQIRTYNFILFNFLCGYFARMHAINLLVTGSTIWLN